MWSSSLFKNHGKPVACATRDEIYHSSHEEAQGGGNGKFATFSETSDALKYITDGGESATAWDISFMVRMFLFTIISYQKVHFDSNSTWLV